METTIHYLLHSLNYLHEMKGGHSWTTFSIGEKIYNKNDCHISVFPLFGISSNNDASNIYILNATIPYILATKRFDVILANS